MLAPLPVNCEPITMEPSLVAPPGSDLSPSIIFLLPVVIASPALTPAITLKVPVVIELPE